MCSAGNERTQEETPRDYRLCTVFMLSLIHILREQYTDFYRDKERWRYLQKLDTKNSLLSLDGFTDSEGNPLDFIADEAMDVAEIVVNAVMVDRLKAALPLLSDSEQELIQAIFFDGLSEREVGARLGITPVSYTHLDVYKRQAPIVTPLTKYFCKNGYSRTIGPVATTVIASFTGSLGTCADGIPARAAAFIIPWLLLRISFK